MRVALLADGVQEPGYRRVTFDGTGLPAGVHLCRMTAGSFNSAGKMLLVK